MYLFTLILSILLLGCLAKSGLLSPYIAGGCGLLISSIFSLIAAP